MHLGNDNLWKFFCERMFCMLSTQWPIFSSSKLVSELHQKSHVTLGWEEDKIRILTLLKNCVVMRMLDLSVRLIHRDWPVINIPDGHKMKKYLEICGIPSVSLHLSPFPLISSFFANLPSIHSPSSCTTLNWLTRHRLKTQLQNDRQTRVRVCVCQFHSAVCRLS